MFKKIPFVYDFLRFSMLPLKEIDKFLPKQGKIIDLGCGEGIITRYLAKNQNRKVIGVDSDKKRISKSNLDNLEYVLADIRTYKFDEADGVVISDVLHHLNFTEQKQLISKINKSLNRSGSLIIKEIDTSEFIRSRLSRFWDFIFYPSDKIYYWNYDNFKNYLKKIGFVVKINRPVRFFPGSTTLFVCKKN